MLLEISNIKKIWNPLPGQYLAFSQGIQAFWEYLFNKDWKVPTGHGFGLLDPSGQKCPTGQFLQILFSINFPNAQLCKTELPTGQCLLGGHFLQLVFPASSWNDPSGHFWHVIVPFFVEKLPGAQSFQSARFSENYIKVPTSFSGFLSALKHVSKKVSTKILEMKMTDKESQW